MASKWKVPTVFLFTLFLCPNLILTSDLGLGNLAEMFSMLAGGEGCLFKCPSGHSPKKNPTHESTSDGCGSFGLVLDTSDNPGFRECCDKHDICYDTCNTIRETCDKDFKECLNDACHHEAILKKRKRKQLQDCQKTGDMMYAGALGLGCASFKEAQRNACLCNNRKISKKEMEELDKAEEL